MGCRHSVHKLGLTLIGRSRESTDPQCLFFQSRLSICLQAAAIVFLASLTAWLIGRVDVVVSLLGTLCGCTVMFTIPGLCGIFLYDAKGEFACLVEKDKSIASSSYVIRDTLNS